jgi:hypothetical protein
MYGLPKRSYGAKLDIPSPHSRHSWAWEDGRFDRSGGQLDLCVLCHGLDSWSNGNHHACTGFYIDRIHCDIHEIKHNPWLIHVINNSFLVVDIWFHFVHVSFYDVETFIHVVENLSLVNIHIALQIWSNSNLQPALPHPGNVLHLWSRP